MANLPDFQRMKVPGGESKYREPVMPGEQRLTPEMQQRMQPSPVLPSRSLPQAQKSPTAFLLEFLAGGAVGMGKSAVSPDLARTLSGISYMGSDRIDANPSVVRDIIDRGALGLLGRAF